MVLNDFLKVLDTREPIMIYLNGDELKAYKMSEIPGRFLNMELTDVFVDDEGLGVSIYS